MTTINNATFAYVTNSGDNTVSVIDTANRRVINTIPVGGLSWSSDVAITPDGKFVYVTNSLDDTVSVIDRASHSVVNTISGLNGPSGIAINPTGNSAYVANGNGSVSVIDTANHTVTTSFSVGQFPKMLTAVAFSPNGQRAYVTDPPTQVVWVIDTATTHTIGQIGAFCFGIVITPDGRHGYVTTNDNNDVSVFDTTANTVTKRITLANTGGPLTVTPDGKFIYVGCGTLETVVIETGSNTVKQTISGAGGHGCFGQAITPDGRFVYVTNDDNDTVSVIDTATNTVTGAPIHVGRNPRAVAI